MEAIKNKKILVTGGAGFLGSYVSEYLCKNNEVTVLDNLSSGSAKNIEHIKSRIKFVQQDISKQFITNEKYDIIFHMASLASPKFYQKFPINTLDANVFGTKQMLELAKKNNAIFFFTSTSEVYGNAQVVPTPENYYGYVNSFGPRSCYDESKRCAEAYIYSFIQQEKVDARIVRIFNTYGERMSNEDGRVIPNFINQVLDKKPITIYGKGSQTRSYCYVSDLIEGFMKILSSKKEKVCGEIFNLGNPEEYTVLELAEKIKKMMNSNSKIIFEPLPKDDPVRRKPDISKAKKILDWEPKINLETGLKKTIEYFEKVNS